MEQKICNHTTCTGCDGSKINMAFAHRGPWPGPGFPHHPPMPHGWDRCRPFMGQCGINCIPGVAQGLYHPDGPLNILKSSVASIAYLTNVNAQAKTTLVFTFSYSNESLNKTVELTTDQVYTITYLEEGQLNTVTGKVSNIWKVYGNDDTTSSFYKIKIDASADYATNTVVIKNDQIRDITLYVEHADEDTTLESSLHKYGTTVGTITNAIVTNATIDANGNLIEGDIVQGVVDGFTHDGTAQGTNSLGTQMIVINGTTTGGNILNGKIISAYHTSGDTEEGTFAEGTNILEHATVKGVLTNAVIVNTTVEGGKTVDGTFLEQKIENSVVFNAKITGDDLVTTGGITCGNVTSNGTSIGGTAYGGTATGQINGRNYTIEAGTTVAKPGSKLTTTGGIVVGGTIIGGTQVGNMIVGATIKGGTVTNGTTINGVTTGGEIIPVAGSNISLAQVSQNISEIDLKPNFKPANSTNSSDNPFDENGLVIYEDLSSGDIRTNLATTKMGTIQHL